jgi:hypothetical protein
MPAERLEPEVMDKILKLAEAMRAQNKDKYRMAHALLYLEQRNRLLEDLYHKVERYFHSGMAELELRDLRLAFERIREADVEDADSSALFARE